MGSGYWGRVGKLAWADTLRALSLDTTERVVLRVLAALVSVAVVWIALGFTDAARSIVVRVLAASSIFLILPAVFVWKFIAAPSKLDADQRAKIRELESLLKVDSNELARQKAIDNIAEEIAWAVNNLINPKPFPTSTGDTEADFKLLQTKIDAWCDRVNSKLAASSVFTVGDKVHFDSLGSIPLVTRYGHQKLDWLHSALVLRLERLREIEERARNR